MDILSRVYDMCFGTTRRTEITFLCLFVLYCLTHPAFTAELVSLVLQLAIIGIAIIYFYKKVLKGSSGGGGGKKKSP